MRKFISGILFACAMIVTAYGETTPEQAMTGIIKAITSGDLDKALSFCETENYVKGFSFEDFSNYIKAFIITGPAPNKSSFFQKINRYDRINMYCRQIKFFCYGFTENTDVRQISTGMTAAITDEKQIPDFTTSVDPEKLKNLTTVKTFVIRPGEKSRLKTNWDRLAKIYGADEIVEGAALLNLNGNFYMEGFQFIRYGKKWTIFSLNSSLMNTSSFGSPQKTTEEEFDSAVSEIEEIAKRPISE